MTLYELVDNEIVIVRSNKKGMRNIITTIYNDYENRRSRIEEYRVYELDANGEYTRSWDIEDFA